MLEFNYGVGLRELVMGSFKRMDGTAYRALWPKGAFLPPSPGTSVNVIGYPPAICSRSLTDHPMQAAANSPMPAQTQAHRLDSRMIMPMIMIMIFILIRKTVTLTI